MDFMSTEFAENQAELDFSSFCSRIGKIPLSIDPAYVAEVLWNVPTIFLDEGTLPDDALAYIDFEEKRIVVDCCAYEPRNRFSVAHEVGHLSLHRYLVELGEVYDKYEQFRERQADTYASALLLPKALVTSFIESKAGLLDSPEYLVAITQERFDVSKPVAQIRLKHLKLIPSNNTGYNIKNYDKNMGLQREDWQGERW